MTDVLHETRTQEIGRRIFALARRSRADDSGGWLDRIVMQMGMRDERLKARMFQFVDVLPALHSPRQINQVLRQYLEPVHDRFPWPLGAAIRHIPDDGFLGGQLANLTEWNVRRLARRFIGATDVDEARRAIDRLRRQRYGFTIDLLGEAVLADSEAKQYQRRYLDLIDGLADHTKHWPADELIDRDHRREIPRLNVSLKLSALVADFEPIDPAGTCASVREMLRPILRRARERGAFVNIDMEQRSFKDATIRTFCDVLDEEEFRDWEDVGIAIQAYLKESGDDLDRLSRWAEKRGTPVWIRLVKGAYWDYETTIAAQEGWPVPVFTQKPESDTNFETLTTFLLERHEILRPAIASHNVRSIAHALAAAERLHVPLQSIEFQSLYGMAAEIRSALVAMNQRVRVYTPMGELLPGMAYLVRRLLENTSNESFLRAGFLENLPEEKLLMNPVELLSMKRKPQPTPAPRGEFVNDPLADFSREETRQRMQDALADVRAQLGRTYPLVVNGRDIATEQTIESINPSHRREIIGRAASATVEHATAAIAAAKSAFLAWRDLSAKHRADYLFKSADILRRRRFELAAWEVFECGKQWREADADVAEAIDYCNYYAREALRLANTIRRDMPGEENEYFYEPRGVAVVIAPWNFPLAILCGMTTAAIVTGNTAIMKPAEQSPIIAAMLMQVFTEAGLPNGVVNFLPGIGENIGPTLVSHPDVAIIAFTGSRAVGLQIQHEASINPPGQDHVKRVITEMGGKNAIIIDDTADLDEAVAATVASSFGYAGQKCSAASRVIVLDAVHDQFLTRLIEATRSLKIGPAEDPAAFVGPVIDQEARDRILKRIDHAKAYAKLVHGGTERQRRPAPPEVDLSTEGYFITPHIFADVDPQSELAQEEIFGPVLAVLRAANLDDALKIANSTQYALTGGIFSRTPASVDRARREFRVGNLYINRKITGALVDRQPFGGFKLSGIGSKAGGPDYLPQFTVPRVVTENTLRHGFAPPTPGE